MAGAFALLALAPAQPVAADRIVAAVASNFTDTAHAIGAEFEAASGHWVTLLPGSTGKRYAQIVHGQQLDVFLAADVEHPRRLEERGLAVPGSRFTYAVGRLVLYSATRELEGAGGRVLESGAFHRLAIANPELAPYGRAAREALTALGLWETLHDRLARAESVSQAFQFAVTGNAELGLVARAQVRSSGGVVHGSIWEVPPELYSPIEQQAVLLRDTAAGRGFLAFLRGAAARRILIDHGYSVPDHAD